MVDKGTKLMFSAIYGSRQPSTRKLLWSDLTSASLSQNISWLMAGDFNVTVSINERKGETSRLNYGCNAVKAFINTMG